MKFLKNSKGFTLAEMLIVMAVVVVLAAAAMPAVSNQVEAAREANDIDAIRTAYSQAYTQAYMDITNGGDVRGAAEAAKPIPALTAGQYAVVFTPSQKTAGWSGSAPKVAGSTVADLTAANLADATKVGYVIFTFTANNTKDGVVLATTGAITFAQAAS